MANGFKQLSAFGKMVLSARKRKGYSQKHLSLDADIPQATISAWETGRQIPRPTGDKVDRLAGCLGVKLTDLQEAINGQKKLRPAPGTLITESEYQTQIRSYLDYLSPTVVDIWLLGPGPLPIVDSEDMRNLWLQQLNQGNSFNILWVLDGRTRPAQIEDVLDACEKIATRTDDGTTGKIYWHAFAPNWARDEIGNKQYTSIQNSLPGHPSYDAIARILAVGDIRRDDSTVGSGIGEHGLRLTHFLNAYGSVALYNPPNPSVRPLAAISVQDVKSSWDGDSVPSGYLFLNRANATALRALTTRLQALYRDVKGG